MSYVNTSAAAAAASSTTSSPPQSHDSSLTPPCLSVWIIGNPTSGGKRGAVVLGRLAKLFQKTYGADAVQETRSSHFLSLAFPPCHTSTTTAMGNAANGVSGTGQHPCNATRHTSSSDKGSSDDVFLQLPTLDVIWSSGVAPSTAAAGPTPPITPPSSPQNPSSPTATAMPSSTSTAGTAANPAGSFASCAGGVAVRTMLIHTDQGGHAKPVSNALSRLILRSRLADQQTASPAAAAGEAHDAELCTVPGAQHLVLVVGGDGTLSEVVNGLCEGTLAAYQHFTTALHGSASTAAAVASSGALNSNSFGCANGRAKASPADRFTTPHFSGYASHAQVEQEAAVLTRLLPAVLYVPGGTGADFAKLHLCCPTPEAALHVVRDGVVKMLFRPLRSQATTATTTTATATNYTHDSKQTCAAEVATKSHPAASSVPACYACPVDIGRIEFLCTGTRHFFINIASIGMSCDVIRRGERFKRSKFVSKLGGTLLFALSALISLFLMTPKPLYLCKLPPRTTRGNVAMAANEDDGAPFDLAGNAHVNGCSSSVSNGQAKSINIASRAVNGEHSQAEKTHWPPRNDATATAAARGRRSPQNSLLCIPSFAPLGDQLRCLQAEVPQHQQQGSAAERLSSSGRAHPFSSLHGESVYAPSRDESAYSCHADTTMPPRQAKIVQCTTETPSGEVRQLLDINEAELQTLRRQQRRQLQRMLAPPPHADRNGSGSKGGGGAMRRGDASLSAGHGGATNGFHHGRQTTTTTTTPPQQQLHDGHGAGLTSRSLSCSGEVDVDDFDDDLAGLTWVKMPSSMVAFANGRWYGGGMHVAPHANPTDGLLSCTNWVATVLPFVSGVLSLYTGRHLRWCSTSAFEGERFLVCNTPPRSIDFEAEPLYMEADGEVLEPVPAIVELVGKVTFIVPRSAQLCVGDAAPGTTRARVDAAVGAATLERSGSLQLDSNGSTPFTAPLIFTQRTASADTCPSRLRRAAGGLNAWWRRSWSYAQRWWRRDDRLHSDSARDEDDSGREYMTKRTVSQAANTTRRTRDGNADEFV